MSAASSARRHVRRGGAFHNDDFDLLLNSRGLLARLFRPLFRLVTQSWHMLPLGFLFGLGFDTATEVVSWTPVRGPLRRSA